MKFREGQRVRLRNNKIRTIKFTDLLNNPGNVKHISSIELSDGRRRTTEGINRYLTLQSDSDIVAVVNKIPEPLTLAGCNHIEAKENSFFFYTVILITVLVGLELGLAVYLIIK